MVRLRLTPKRRADALIVLGVLLLSLGAGWWVHPAASLVVAGISAVLAGLFLVPDVDGARESLPARPHHRTPPL